MTRLNYQARWREFRKWCREFHHRPSEPAIPKITEFFIFLFRTEKTAVSTIKGCRSMPSSVYKFCLPEISTSPILKDRDLSSSSNTSVAFMGFGQGTGVLVRAPFEPLAEASCRNKTRKARSLLTMATAKRVGSLQALSFSVSHQGDDLVLH